MGHWYGYMDGVKSALTARCISVENIERAARDTCEWRMILKVDSEELCLPWLFRCEAVWPGTGPTPSRCGGGKPLKAIGSCWGWFLSSLISHGDRMASFPDPFALRGWFFFVGDCMKKCVRIILLSPTTTFFNRDNLYKQFLSRLWGCFCPTL